MTPRPPRSTLSSSSAASDVYKRQVCSCGTKNSGKFCSECGKPRPAAQCANCGWKPADPTRLPKFCPECGKPFGA